MVVRGGRGNGDRGQGRAARFGAAQAEVQPRASPSPLPFETPLLSPIVPLSCCNCLPQSGAVARQLALPGRAMRFRPGKGGAGILRAMLAEVFHP